MKTVLIGGLSDGRRVDVPEHSRVIRMPIVKPVQSRIDYDAVEMHSTINEEVYKIEKVSTHTWIAIHESQVGRSFSDLLGLLASGYRAELG